MRRHNGRRAAFLLIIGLVLSCEFGNAQLMTTGTINGTITDRSGAVVPGADVTITNIATGAVIRTVSNSGGSFSQAGLAVGSYDLTAGRPGFALFKEADIYVGPASVDTVSIVLEPSTVTTTVSVEASAAQVQTATSELSSTVSAQEAEALPLNGRNYQGLGSLMPGVINTSPIASMGTGGFNTSNALNVNGGGSSGSFYTLDGIWNENTGNETQTTIMPNPDEIQEIKVLQSNYDSQYTLMGASVVIVQTKSGTSTFHGGGWEFLRNTDFDARNFFSPTVSPLQWNIFGWNLGGPLYIPRVYNTKREKTFFYVNQQWVRQKVGSVLNGATPTPDMRAGIFPTTGPYASNLKDPAGGSFPGNRIPVSRINQAALAYLNAIAPLPNQQTSAFNNYLNTNAGTTNQRDDMVKIDHDFSPRVRLMGEYFHEGQDSSNPAATRMGSPFSTNYDIFQTFNSLAQIQLTQVISPSMVNQTSIAMNRYIINHIFGGLTAISQIPGYSQNFPYTGGYLQDLVPHVTFTGGWSQFGTSANNIIPRATDLEDTLTDNWSWLRGTHTLDAGGTILFGTKRQWATGLNTTGDVNVNGTFTGNAIADYLLGDSATFNQGSNGIRKYIHYPIVSPYLQDHWKATRRFTVTAGVRFFYLPFPHTQPGYMDNFDPAQFNAANAAIVSPNGTITSTPNYSRINGMIFNGQNGVPLNLTNQHNFYVAPVGGFAWDLFGDGRTSLRGGFGITYNRNGGMGAACSQGCVSYPVVQQVNLINANFPDPIGGKAAPLTAASVAGMSLSYRVAKIESFSLSLQHQFGSNWLVSIAGAGNIARDLQTSLNINQPGPFGTYGFNPNLNSSAYTAAYYAPYQGYGTINFSEPIGIDNWSALEIGVRHPVGHNLYLTAAYTWSHNLDNAGGFQNVYQLQQAYGNSSLNTPQVFTVSAVYTL
ncbi:MAG: carboxypeptidase regulatory-like domain-containing protein, partial [Acidobacteriaceae bacterium]|nr:carboxypeptidase regulatory-like domain-containing protein [Acidobacteriaceae bacterium]